ncbi:unnamed protein product [Linum trigynum]|uniref:High light inducible protein n=1 Tax=Linum trigynum TaxID=586398 RepID=A0AAV2FC61_9ROSI
MRKARKQGASSKSSEATLYLPPVPLKEPVSAGLKVEFGFTPYSERLNGRIAFLGLAVLLELATGKGVLSYHTPSIVLVLVQI